MKIPKVGDRIASLMVTAQGELQVSPLITSVKPPYNGLSSDEFYDGQCRHSISSLYPNSTGIGGKAPQAMFPKSMHLWCLESDIKEACECLVHQWLSVHIGIVAELKSQVSQIEGAIKRSES